MATGRYKVKNLGQGRYNRRHRLIAEKAIGHALPPTAEIHHVDGDRSNDGPGNLVICPSRAYHMLLHRRTRALAATGNPNARPCQLCRQFIVPGTPDATFGTYREPHRGGTRDLAWHRDCLRLDRQRRRSKP